MASRATHNRLNVEYQRYGADVFTKSSVGFLPTTPCGRDYLYPFFAFKIVRPREGKYSMPLIQLSTSRLLVEDDIVVGLAPDLLALYHTLHTPIFTRDITNITVPHLRRAHKTDFVMRDGMPFAFRCGSSLHPDIALCPYGTQAHDVDPETFNTVNGSWQCARCFQATVAWHQTELNPMKAITFDEMERFLTPHGIFVTNSLKGRVVSTIARYYMHQTNQPIEPLEHDMCVRSIELLNVIGSRLSLNDSIRTVLFPPGKSKCAHIRFTGCMPVDISVEPTHDFTVSKPYSRSDYLTYAPYELVVRKLYANRFHIGIIADQHITHLSHYSSFSVFSQHPSKEIVIVSAEPVSTPEYTGNKHVIAQLQSLNITLRTSDATIIIIGPVGVASMSILLSHIEFDTPDIATCVIWMSNPLIAGTSIHSTLNLMYAMWQSGLFTDVSHLADVARQPQPPLRTRRLFDILVNAAEPLTLTNLAILPGANVPHTCVLSSNLLRPHNKIRILLASDTLLFAYFLYYTPNFDDGCVEFHHDIDELKRIKHFYDISNNMFLQINKS